MRNRVVRPNRPDVGERLANHRTERKEKKRKKSLAKLLPLSSRAPLLTGGKTGEGSRRLRAEETRAAAAWPLSYGCATSTARRRRRRAARLGGAGVAAAGGRGQARRGRSQAAAGRAARRARPSTDGDGRREMETATAGATKHRRLGELRFGRFLWRR